ncbi:hypothetical protein [Bradyrhizobium sp.]|uniref:hypothetical protein n=1 Tax=Bradyrhizobium sp. TaxID=376 RepID=UPI003C7358D7
MRIRQLPTSFRNPFGLWMKAVWYKANPRSSDYMKARFAECYPGSTFLNTGAGAISAAALAGSSKVVLLYPDSIGLGYSAIERAVARDAPHAAVEVLNGRRRQFAFDRKARWALRFRRFLEWTMLIECLAGVTLLLATPFLLLFDFLRGKT